MLICVKCLLKVIANLKIKVPYYPNYKIFIFIFWRYGRVKLFLKKYFLSDLTKV